MLSSKNHSSWSSLMMTVTSGSTSAMVLTSSAIPRWQAADCSSKTSSVSGRSRTAVGTCASPSS